MLAEEVQLVQGQVGASKVRHPEGTLSSRGIVAKGDICWLSMATGAQPLLCLSSVSVLCPSNSTFSGMDYQASKSLGFSEDFWLKT